MLTVRKFQIAVASLLLAGLLFLTVTFPSIAAITAGDMDAQPVTIACTSGSGSGNSCGY